MGSKRLEKEEREMELLKSFGIAILGLTAFGLFMGGILYGMWLGFPILLHSSAWKAYVAFVDWFPKPSDRQIAIGLIVIIVFLFTSIVYGMRNDPYWGNKPKPK